MSQIHGTIDSNLYGSDPGLSPVYYSPFILDNGQTYSGPFYSGPVASFGPDYRSGIDDAWKHPLQGTGYARIQGTIGGGVSGTVYKISLRISGGSNQQFDIGGQNVTTATAVAGDGGTQSFSMFAEYQPTGNGDYMSLPRMVVSSEPNGRSPAATVQTIGSQEMSDSPTLLYAAGDKVSRTLISLPSTKTGVFIERGAEIGVRCPLWNSNYTALATNGLTVELWSHSEELDRAALSNSYSVPPGGYLSFARSTASPDDTPDGEPLALVVSGENEATEDEVSGFWRAVSLNQQMIRAGFDVTWTPRRPTPHSFEVQVVRRYGYVLSTQ